MATNATVSFVGGAPVYVQALANAAFTQSIVITPQGQSNSATFSGSGSNNTNLPLTTEGFLTAGSSGGQANFTPSGNSSNNSFYNVTISANGTASTIEANSFQLTSPAGGTLAVAIVVSEDYTDNDYNDGVAVFMQWLKPSA